MLSYQEVHEAAKQINVNATNKKISMMTNRFAMELDQIKERMQNQFQTKEEVEEEHVFEFGDEDSTVKSELPSEEKSTTEANGEEPAVDADASAEDYCSTEAKYDEMSREITINPEASQPPNFAENVKNEVNQLAKRERKMVAVSKAIEAFKKKETKQLQRQQKDEEKHAQRVEQIRATVIEEEDDKDVQFWYRSQCPQSAALFADNQKAQMCSTTYSATDIFEHSFYGIRVNGTVINYLCSLLVSGTPDFNGFVDAHKQLGGVYVEKKNGGHLFYFEELIKYHKTLHKPHKSSRFDHCLYRRFYRNCGLHPFYFKQIMN